MRSILPLILAASLLAGCAPRAVPAAPPVREGMRTCVIQDGETRMIPIRTDAEGRDTVAADGRPLSAVSPASLYASGRGWYERSEPIVVRGRRYVKYGIVRAIFAGDLARVDEFQGVGVYAERNAPALPEIIYIPHGTGCEFQAYEGPHARRP